jgi:L-lactate dehydrogenase
MDGLKPKISIIGCGNVGMRFAYSVAIKGLARSLVLVDVNRKRLEADALDLSHGAPFYSPIDINAGDYADIGGSDLVVVTAGKSILPGQTRLEIAKTNAELFKSIIPQIVKYAPSSIILVVSNPVDILSYVAYKLSGKPSGEVIGSGTVLDSSRLRFLLGQDCSVDTRNIHAYVLGEHGDSEFPCWSKAMIGGVALNDYCAICGICDNNEKNRKLQNIFNEVKNSAYKIIEGKGETSYGIGLAMARITQAVVHDENSILPVSCLVNGFLGQEELYISLPAIVNKDGVREVVTLKLNESEEASFKVSAEAVKRVLKEIGF